MGSSEEPPVSWSTRVLELSLHGSSLLLCRHSWEWRAPSLANDMLTTVPAGRGPRLSGVLELGEWPDESWVFLVLNANTLTALAGIAGVLIAVILGWYSIRSAERTFRGTATEHLDRLVADLVSKANDFQHSGLFLVWAPDPSSSTEEKRAIELRRHETFAELKSSIETLAHVTLEGMSRGLKNLLAASWVLYFSSATEVQNDLKGVSSAPWAAIWDAAVKGSSGQGRPTKPWPSAWEETRESLANQGASDRFVAKTKDLAYRTYPAKGISRCSQLQLADAVFNAAKQDFLITYRTLDAVQLYDNRRHRPRRNPRALVKLTRSLAGLRSTVRRLSRLRLRRISSPSA